MRTTAEAPVLVQLAVDHEVIAGCRVAAVTVDRTEHNRTSAPAGKECRQRSTGWVVTRPTIGADGSSRIVLDKFAYAVRVFPKRAA